jgi:hypothetical protein
MKVQAAMEADMIKILVYYHDVLRYTIWGDSDKVQELRNEGFYVEVRVTPVHHQGYALK